MTTCAVELEAVVAESCMRATIKAMDEQHIATAGFDVVAKWRTSWNEELRAAALLGIHYINVIPALIAGSDRDQA